MMDCNKERSFDPKTLFDNTASDHILYEQFWAFLRDGHTGSDFVTMIWRHVEPGIEKHVSRLLVIMSDVLVEFENDAEMMTRNSAVVQRKECADDSRT